METTSMKTVTTREAIMAEASSWIGTPYHKAACVKGAGVDCAMLLWGVYKNCGLVPEDDRVVERYSQDWFANTDREKYLFKAMRYAHKVAEGVSYPTLKALPGCLALVRSPTSKLFNHGGIVMRWPHLIHAVDPEVQLACASTHSLWAYRNVVILDPFARPALEEEPDGGN
jgi:cell wall-associated NlpC family hydrolase